MKKKMTIWARTAKVLLIAIFSSFGTNAMAQTQTRIAVVSDIHVMAPSLLPGENPTGTDWNTDYANERKMLEQSAGLFDQFVTTMTTEAPDVLLITGDLTKDGEMVSHEYVKGKLAELKSIKIFVIPGNHDIATGTVYKYPNGNRTALENNEKMTSTDAFATFYADYGYGTTNIRDENSLSYMVEIDDDLYLLAIDSHDGNVSQETLDWIQTQASGKRVIAMMHHPLFPHIEGANMFVNSYTVNNYATVRNALIAAGVNVILTGHFHTSDIAYDWNESQTNGIYDINTGSLISYPCDYRMLTLSSDKSTLSVATASLTEIPSGSTSWKAWLHDRVKTIAKSQGEAKIPSLRDKLLENNPNMPDIALNLAISLARSQINELAEFAADLFILHAEGNEPVSQESGEYGNYYNQAETYDGLASSLGYDLSFINLAHSMLEDKSNYGNDHVNQTNDRTLAINLNSPSSLLLELDNNDDNSSVINYYNGKTATVTLTGRTLVKNDKWNTFCVPYGVTAVQIADEDNPLHGATIRELDASASSLSSDGELTLTFTSASAIEAGKPYIVKWATGTDITNPVFSGVTINNAGPTAVEFANNAGTELCKFVGQYNPFAITTDNLNEIIYIGSDNKIGYSQAARTLNCFRAHFWVQPNGTSAGARSISLNLGDGSATSISLVNADDAVRQTGWYSVDGIRLQDEPTKKGVYINNGKKVIIK